MKDSPRFGVVVPAKGCRASDLKRTIVSIVEQDALQSNSVSCKIVLVHHGLADDLIEQVRSWVGPAELVEISDPGDGMYAALARSFDAISDSDVNSYLGVGDAYEPQAFTVVTELLAHYQGAQFWITGIISSRRKDGALVRSLLPHYYKSHGLRRGIYGRLLPSIQQESTFWSPDLMQRVDISAFASLKLAGDYFLWWSFSSLTQPIVVEAQLASFRWHGDNQSADWDGYLSELAGFLPKLNVLDRVWATKEKIAWSLPNRWKHVLGSGQVVRWNWPEGPWV